MKIFKPYTLVFTDYLLPAAAAISCGAQLMRFDEDSEQPIIRYVTKDGGKSIVRSRFQFRSMTTRGEKVTDLLAAYRALDKGEAAAHVPADHVLRYAQRALAARDRIHRQLDDARRRPPTPLQFGGSFCTENTEVAAALVALGYECLEVRNRDGRSVDFSFAMSDAPAALAAAFVKPWGQYDFDQGHPIYHMKGAMENRRNLIANSKLAKVRASFIEGGMEYQVPMDASPEQIQGMIAKLSQ